MGPMELAKGCPPATEAVLAARIFVDLRGPKVENPLKTREICYKMLQACAYGCENTVRMPVSTGYTWTICILDLDCIEP